ncbi:hypothetical protein LTR85_009495 [Meristemomyces frigidus]|nr:hypothetical protein LTR85_009495 [Meristemomyces frigidus]
MRLCEASFTPGTGIWANIGQAEYTTYDQIGQYGWTTHDDEKNADESTAVKPALDAHNIPEVADISWTKVKWENDKEVNVDGHSYLPSEAYYINIFNPTHGAILAVDNHAPKDTAPDMHPADITALYRWSDIAFLTWEHLTGTSQTQLRGLKYILGVNVINDDTMTCIQNFAPANDIDNLPQWPGLTFDTTSVAGMTLLGSPNGAGIGWFLLQHKDKLGSNRHVIKITVWESATPEERDMLGPIPCMLFGISDYAA